MFTPIMDPHFPQAVLSTVLILSAFFFFTYPVGDLFRKYFFKNEPRFLKELCFGNLILTSGMGLTIYFLLAIPARYFFSFSSISFAFAVIAVFWFFFIRQTLPTKRIPIAPVLTAVLGSTAIFLLIFPYAVGIPYQYYIDEAYRLAIANELLKSFPPREFLATSTIDQFFHYFGSEFWFAQISSLTNQRLDILFYHGFLPANLILLLIGVLGGLEIFLKRSVGSLEIVFTFVLTIYLFEHLPDPSSFFNTLCREEIFAFMFCIFLYPIVSIYRQTDRPILCLVLLGLGVGFVVLSKAVTGLFFGTLLGTVLLFNPTQIREKFIHTSTLAVSMVASTLFLYYLYIKSPHIGQAFSFVQVSPIAVELGTKLLGMSPIGRFLEKQLVSSDFGLGFSFTFIHLAGVLLLAIAIVALHRKRETISWIVPPLVISALGGFFFLFTLFSRASSSTTHWLYYPVFLAKLFLLIFLLGAAFKKLNFKGRYLSLAGFLLVSHLLFFDPSSQGEAARLTYESGEVFDESTFAACKYVDLFAPKETKILSSFANTTSLYHLSFYCNRHLYYSKYQRLLTQDIHSYSKAYENAEHFFSGKQDLEWSTRENICTVFWDTRSRPLGDTEALGLKLEFQSGPIKVFSFKNAESCKWYSRLEHRPGS